MSQVPLRRQIMLAQQDFEYFMSRISEPNGNQLCFLPDDPGCVLWEGPTDDRGYGYTKVAARRHRVAAHHVAWTIEHGRVPADPDLVVDHLCQVPSCVSTLHMEWVTKLENMRRIDGRRPVCRRGHGWLGLLPLYRPDSQLRVCFQCTAEGKPPPRPDRRVGKSDRMKWCPRAHDVSGDNGYDLPGIPGKRGCVRCTEDWKAKLPGKKKS